MAGSLGFSAVRAFCAGPWTQRRKYSRLQLSKASIYLQINFSALHQTSQTDTFTRLHSFLSYATSHHLITRFPQLPGALRFTEKPKIRTSDTKLAAAAQRHQSPIKLDGCQATTTRSGRSVARSLGTRRGRNSTNLSKDSSKSTQLQQQARIWFRSSFRSKYSQQHRGSVSSSSDE